MTGKWVSVTEALPGFGEDNTVIVQTFRDQYFAWLSKDGTWKRYDEHIYMDVDVHGVRYWFALPDPPEDKK